MENQEDFLESYRLNADLVYRICFLYLKQAADAEDAAQTVFLRLLQKKPAFASPEHQRAWLIAAARNHCKNQLLHWWRRKRADAAPPAEEPPPERGLLEEVLALPEPQRVAVYLYYYEGYQTAEIAHMLSQKESTVRSRLRLAREKLRLMLKEEME